MKKHFITFLLLVGMTASLTAQQKYQPTEANLKARSEFQDNKFGIFLHWTLCHARYRRVDDDKQ